MFDCSWHILYCILCIYCLVTFADLGDGNQAFTDAHPSSSTEEIHSGPSQTAEISSQQTSGNQWLHAGVPLVSPHLLSFFFYFVEVALTFYVWKRVSLISCLCMLNIIYLPYQVLLQGLEGGWLRPLWSDGSADWNPWQNHHHNTTGHGHSHQCSQERWVHLSVHFVSW